MSNLIKKITAPNGGVFTGEGTNTYLIGKNDITVVDPGPNIESHLNEIIKEGKDKIKRIIVTHTHKDHSPGAAPLAAKLNVPVMGAYPRFDMGEQDKTFNPDSILKDKDLIKTNEYSMEVIHTPGHASNHLCFLIHEEKCLLTGDHIMNGSTVVIAPGHGDYLKDSKAVVDWIINHRLSREDKIIESMKKLKNTTIEELLLDVYDDVDPRLHPIAIWSLEAHLIRLKENSVVTKSDNLWKIAN
jgi:glyoxylase-like metal-dependent hydrolase (beta-lactamase superfamily II)